MKSIMKMMALVSVLTIVAACSTWDGMSKSEKGTVIGTGAGAVIGAQMSDGRVLGTAGGAAVGALIGNQVGKNL